MERWKIAWIGLVMVALGGRLATAQSPGGWYPIERPVYQNTTVFYGAQPAAYMPGTNEYPAVSTRWDAASPVSLGAGPAVPLAGAPTMSCTPVASPPPAVTYVPVASRCVTPTVAYMPVVARYPVPVYTTYSPVAAGYAAPVAAAGPKVWVHPKVYVEGQPIRNLLRAITP